METKEKNILQQEMGQFGKKGYARQIAIEKMVIALRDKVVELESKIKLIEGDIILLK